MKPTPEILQSFDISKHLDRYELERILAHSDILTFMPGSTILQQGKKSSAIYLILEGQVCVVVQLLSERLTTIETFGPGEFIGEIRFIEQTPCGTSIVAKTEVKCLVLNRLLFDLLTLYYPETKQKLLTVINNQVARRIKLMHNQVLNQLAELDIVTTTSFFSHLMQSITKQIRTKVEIDSIKPFLIQFLTQASFTQDEINELLPKMQVWDVPKNDEILSANDDKISCYIVIHGAVQTNIIKDNKAAKLSIIGPDTFFASIACINKELSLSISFVTCEHSIIVEVSRNEIEFIQKCLPEIWFKFFDLISKSYVALEKSIDKLDIRLQIETYNR